MSDEVWDKACSEPPKASDELVRELRMLAHSPEIAFRRDLGDLAADRIESLSRELASRATPEWQPIETLKDERRALLYCKCVPHVITGIWHPQSGLATDNANLYREATHWMPLPASPSPPSCTGAEDMSDTPRTDALIDWSIHELLEHARTLERELLDQERELMHKEAVVKRQMRELASRATPAVWKLVPVEPTYAMSLAGHKVNRWRNTKPCGDHCVGAVTMPPEPVWEAMLSASPSPQIDMKSIEEQLSKMTDEQLIEVARTGRMPFDP